MLTKMRIVFFNMLVFVVWATISVLNTYYFCFYLFRIGVYGDVQRVKILYNKKDSALVQLAEPHQAQLGTYLQ